MLDFALSLAAGTVVGLINGFATHRPGNRVGCSKHFLKCWATYVYVGGCTMALIIIDIVIKMANGDVFQ